MKSLNWTRHEHHQSNWQCNFRADCDRHGEKWLQIALKRWKDGWVPLFWKDDRRLHGKTKKITKRNFLTIFSFHLHSLCHSPCYCQNYSRKAQNPNITQWLKNLWGTWVAQLVEHLTLVLAQITISGSWDRTPHRALCWVWSLLKIHAPPPLRKHAPSLSKKKVTNYILQYPTCAAEVGIEAKTGNLRVREAVFFIRAISCEIVNWWWVEEKDSPYYSRMGVHLAETLCASEVLKLKKKKLSQLLRNIWSFLKFKMTSKGTHWYIKLLARDENSFLTSSERTTLKRGFYQHLHDTTVPGLVKNKGTYL